jgi:voltage-gated sodium channel
VAVHRRVGFQEACSRLVAWPGFERFIVGVILFNGVLVGVETFPQVMERWGDALHMANNVILVIFILEALAKMAALGRGWLGYFKSGWNIFDFAVIVLSLIPASGDFATVARLIRLLRVLRLVSALPKLRLLVSTLVSSIPGMANVLLLMILVFYIYAVAGFHFFHQHDPDKWGTLGDSLLTLFQIVTLDDWGTIMGKGMELSGWFWIYFVSFVLVGTFIVINLFIAVVINSLDEAREHELSLLQAPPSQVEILRELRRTRALVERLEARFADRDRGGRDTS